MFFFFFCYGGLVGEVDLQLSMSESAWFESLILKTRKHLILNSDS